MTHDDTNHDGTDLASLWQEVKHDLDDSDGDPFVEGPLADKFTHALAEAVVYNNESMTTIDPLLAAFAKNADLKKSTLENKFEEYKQEMSSPVGSTDEDDDDQSKDSNVLGPVDRVLNQRLDYITLYDPTDASADAKYKFHFNSPEIEVEFTGDELNAINNFARTFFEQSGSRYSVEGPADLDKDWHVWIQQFISYCHDAGMVEVEPIVGQRTHAVEDLQNAVENTPATKDLLTAVQQQRPYAGGKYDDEEDEEVVEIPTSIVERVISDHEGIDFNDLQIELDNRGYRAGANRSTQVGRGQNVRLWRLKRDWLDIEIEGEEEAKDEEDDSDDLGEMEDAQVIDSSDVAGDT